MHAADLRFIVADARQTSASFQGLLVMPTTPQVASDRIADVAAQERGLQIRWADGHVSHFHHIWLRDNCYCSDCGETADGVRFLRVCDLDLDVRPQSVRLADNGDLQVRWQPDGHESRYPANWLRRHCYGEAARRRRRYRPALWDAGLAQRLTRFDLARLEADQEAQLGFLETLRDYGVALLQGVAPDEPGLARAGACLGPLQGGVYGGAVFELSPRSARRIIGNSHRAVPPHTDEGYQQDPIGIELLVCDQPSADGAGASILVDGFQVAEKLRQADPAAFDLLSRMTLSFHRRHPGEMDRRAIGRVLCLDGDGDLVGIRYPARNTAPLDVPADLVEPLYEALWKFSAGINDPANMLRLRLERGDCLLFDNHRVFHAREAFSGDRRLLLASVHRQDFHNSLRLLAKELGRADDDLRLPSGAGH